MYYLSIWELKALFYNINRIINNLKDFFTKRILVEHLAMNLFDRRRLKKKYGKKCWRNSDEYNDFYKSCTNINKLNLLMGGLELFLGCVLYRFFYKIDITNNFIPSFILKEIRFIINLSNEKGFVGLLLSWRFMNDIVMIVGIAIIGLVLYFTNSDECITEISLGINMLKFMFIIIIFEYFHFYWGSNVFTLTMVLVISQDIRNICIDISNWIQSKESSKVDYERISILVGIIATFYGFIKK